MTKRGFIFLMSCIVCAVHNIGAQPSPDAAKRAETYAEANTISKLKSKIQRNYAIDRIGPAESDRMAYKAFLKKAKTGITRLVFAVPCSMSRKEQTRDRNKFAKECPTQYLLGNGSNFSFRKNDYASPALADITIKDKTIYSSGILSQGIMVKLGNVPIDEISLLSEGVKFLTDFVPAKTASEADTKSASFSKGLPNGKYLYGAGFRVDENCTFVLRVIAYRANLELMKDWFESHTYRFTQTDPLFGHDERKDIIVAFRIIKVDPDGSVTLIWKELQRKDSPELSVEK